MQSPGYEVSIQSVYVHYQKKVQDDSVRLTDRGSPECMAVLRTSGSSPTCPAGEKSFNTHRCSYK